MTEDPENVEINEELREMYRSLPDVPATESRIVVGPIDALAIEDRLRRQTENVDRYGVLTPPMIDGVFERARRLATAGAPPSAPPSRRPG